MGHEDQLPRPSLSDRCRLGEATFAAMGPKEEDAPNPDLRGTTMEPPESTHLRPSCPRQWLVGLTGKRPFASDFWMLADRLTSIRRAAPLPLSDRVCRSLR
jgi:hypothetical protein